MAPNPYSVGTAGAFISSTGAAQVPVWNLGNFPWHTEEEFEASIRSTVGTVQAGGSTISQASWEQARFNAEAKILSYLPNHPKKYRDMVYRVPGELAPQGGVVEEAGEFVYNVLIPDIVTSPVSKIPRVWKNLTCPWKNRPRELSHPKRLRPNVDFTYTADAVTIADAQVGDRFVIEYHTTLRPVPVILKQLSIYATAELAIIRQFGLGSDQADKWAAVHRAQYMETLNLLQSGRNAIQEFDYVELYEDWFELSDSPTHFVMERA